MTIINLRIGDREIIAGCDVAGYTLDGVSTIRLNDGTLIETTEHVTVRTKQASGDVFIPVKWTQGVNQDEKNMLGGAK